MFALYLIPPIGFMVISYEYAKRNKVKVSQKTINEVEKVKSADTSISSDDLARALSLLRRNYGQEPFDIYKKYSAMLEEAQKSIHSPISLLSLGRYGSLEDWNKAISRMGDFDILQSLSKNSTEK